LTLFIGFRLLVEEGVTTVVVTLEVGRGSLAAEVAVDALIVDVISAVGVLGVFIGSVSHGMFLFCLWLRK
jgi:hypothetical protein